MAKLVLSNSDWRILQALADARVNDIISHMPAGEGGWHPERIIKLRENNAWCDPGGHDVLFTVVIRSGDGSRNELYGKTHLFHGDNGQVWKGYHLFAATQAALEFPQLCVVVEEPTTGSEA